MRQSRPTPPGEVWEIFRSDPLSLPLDTAVHRDEGFHRQAEGEAITWTRAGEWS